MSVERPCIVAELGGYEVTIHKMGIGQLVELLSAVEPYLVKFFGSVSVMAEAGSTLQGFVDDFMGGLGELLSKAPADAVRLFEVIIGVPEGEREWFESEVGPQELFALLPKLDELNHFGAIWAEVSKCYAEIQSRYRKQDTTKVDVAKTDAVKPDVVKTG